MGTADHWDAVYRRGDTTLSWFQESARPSLQLIDAVGVEPQDSVIDIGGGASTLVDALLERGHRDVTVLDISAEALHTARHRLGAHAAGVRWLVADLRNWSPDRTWDVWHDRAVLHFFTADADRRAYLQALAAATGPGSSAVLATFAPHGPAWCSGLPVVQYDARELAALLGHGWELVTDANEEHHTPAGSSQPFTWAAFRRRP